MKNKIALTLMALGLSLPAMNLNAQDGPRGPRGDGSRPPGPPLMAGLDLNRDGVLDASELNAAPESLRSLDKNKDGKLTPDELRPGRGPRPDGDADARPPRRGPGPEGAAGRPVGDRPAGPPVLAALDANQDGVIDATEIANATAALKTLDKNGDGQLSMDEVGPRGPRGPRGAEGERGPRGPRGDRPSAPQQ